MFFDDLNSIIWGMGAETLHFLCFGRSRKDLESVLCSFVSFFFQYMMSDLFIYALIFCTYYVSRY